MTSPYAPTRNRVMNFDGVTPAASQDGVRGGAVLPGGRFAASAGPAFASNGEVNASSKRDLMQQISSLVKSASLQTHLASGSSIEDQQIRMAELREAFGDRSTQKFQVMGEVMSDQIWETLGREGFARKWFAVKPLTGGEVGRIKVRVKDVVAYQITTDVKVQEQRIRQPYVYPSEFYLAANILIEDKEIAQASTDLLDEKFQDGLEAIMRREDLIARALGVRAATSFNDLVIFPTFNPSVLTTMRTQVNRWGTPAATLTMAFDLWDDVIAATDFVAWFDPVHKHELILEGRLGSLLGLEIITDGYRYPTLQVLQPGEVFVTGAPVTLGSITQRKELDSRAIDTYNQGRPARGWFMQQIEGMVLVNGRAITRGTKV